MNLKDKIVLENDKVRLEPMGMFHLEELAPISAKHPDLMKYSPSPFGTPEKIKEYITTSIKDRENKIRYPFAIFDKLRMQYIGSTSYANISNKDLRLEIGWTWIDKESQGTGINNNCKYLLLTHAFENFGFNRVEFRTDSRNIQSRKAIEKIGGKYEGELRSHMIMLDGFRRNTVYYSILKEEWPAIKTKLKLD